MEFFQLCFEHPVATFFFLVMIATIVDIIMSQLYNIILVKTLKTVPPLKIKKEDFRDY